MTEKHKTKLILEQCSQTKTFEFDYSLSTTELVQEMYHLCLAGGHDKGNVAEAFYNLGEELAEIKDNG